MVLPLITYKTGIVAPSAITVLADETYLGYGATSSFGTINEAITVTPSGGNGSYTYLWTIQDQGGTGTVLLNETNQAGVDVLWSDLDFPTSEVNGTLRCTVTDTAGNSGYINIGFVIIRVF